MSEFPSLFIPATPVLGTAVAYSPGDAVGPRLHYVLLQEHCQRAGAVLNLTVTMESILVQPEMELILFDYPFTETADNAPFDPSKADMRDHRLGVVTINVTDWHVYVANQIATVPVQFVARSVANPGDIYGQLITRTAFTAVAEDEITAGLGILLD